jgi:hypothetical protein
VGPSPFTGRITGIPAVVTANSVNDAFGVVSGLSPAAATEAEAETVSPNASFNAQDFYVQTNGLVLGSGNAIVVQFLVAGVSTDVCTIPALGSSCTGPASPITVPAGSTISIEVKTFTGSVSGVPSYDLLFGWRAS